ncbi:MAG: DUF3494 domain-containing protein, partial [Rhodococcus sp. (in: high G+C Gram-positive bacteria)]
MYSPQHRPAPSTSRRKGSALIPLVGTVALATSALMLVNASSADAQSPAVVVPTVGLGAADPYAILAGSTVTDAGGSVINGSVGVSPGDGNPSSVSGLLQGQITNGVIDDKNERALNAKAALQVAYTDAANRSGPELVPVELGGTTRYAGLYKGDTLGLTGSLPLTLDAQGNSAAVFIFQAGSTLITGSNSSVSL